MKSKNTLEKLNNLYHEGEVVLSTSYNNTSSSNGFIFIDENHVDNKKFKKWRYGYILVLEQILDSDSSLLQDFKNKVNYPRYVEAEDGVSILKSLIENIEESNLILNDEISVEKDYKEINENIFLKIS